MKRGGPLLLGVLLTACAGGEQWRITDSTTTLGGDETQGSEDTGPQISASATVSAGPTSSGPSTETGPGTTEPIEGSSSSEGSSTTGDASESSSSSTSFGSSSSGEPTGIDLSGWSIVQTDSDRTYDIPDGTSVPIGGALVIARDSDQAAFEDYWGVTFGPEVVFLSGANDFPTMNGDETYTLRDAGGSVVDGPSPALVLGEVLDRVDPEDGAGWESAVADVGTSTPGTSTEPPAGYTGAFLSEVSDANGTGNYVYEFVEVRVF